MGKTKGTSRSTLAYQNFKDEMDALWNFAVMICYAVPTLKKNIKGVEQKIPNYSIPRNDLFPHDASSILQMKELTRDYKQRLAAYLWLSSFSFFEAFVSGAIKEMIDFHGGAKNFIASGEKSARQAIAKVHPTEVIRSRSRLSGNFRGHRIGRYKDDTRLLEKYGYRFPSELLASFGVRMLVSKSGELRATEIPLLLNQSCHYQFTADALVRYDKYRKIRNNIAHGKSPAKSLKDAFDVKKNLGKLASEIDEHLVTNFFVRESYRN